MLSVALTASSLIFIVAYLLFTTYIYKKESGDSYSFRNCFPFELWIKRSRSFNWANVFLFIALGTGFVNYLIFTINNFSVNNTFLSVYALFSYFGVLTLFYIPPYKLKAFLSFAILTALASTALNFQMLFIIFQNVNIKETIIFYVILVISLILGLVSLVTSFFIRIDDLHMNKDELGNLVRPKRILMAVFEWLTILAIFLSQVSLVLYQIG